MGLDLSVMIENSIGARSAPPSFPFCQKPRVTREGRKWAIASPHPDIMGTLAEEPRKDSDKMAFRSSLVEPRNDGIAFACEREAYTEIREMEWCMRSDWESQKHPSATNAMSAFRIV